MKIICVEEHVLDAGLAEAGRSTVQKNAPYFTEVGNRFRGNIEDGDNKRPMSIGFQITMKLASDYGDGRIAEMDRHHIDMQVLSCSNPPQDTPAKKEVSLTKAANDKLAEAVRKNLPASAVSRRCHGRTPKRLRLN